MRKEKSMNNIDFEQDQRADLDGANDANKLSDQVVKLQRLEEDLLAKEEELKELKRKVELVSGEVIPTMMQEMNISTVLPYLPRVRKKHLNGFEITA